MNRLEKLQFALDLLSAERAQTLQNWYLQNCWVTQSKPGGTARTSHKYWQVRSREPIFDGKRMKHLKADEVEAYKAAIARGRQLKQVDRQIEKLRQQLAKFTTPTESLKESCASLSNIDDNSSASPTPLTMPRSQRLENHSSTLGKSVDLVEQERLVKEVLDNSRALRSALRQAIDRGRKLGARNIDLRRGEIGTNQGILAD